MLPVDGALARVSVGAIPERVHCGVCHRAATRKVLALVHDVLVGGEQFGGIRGGGLKLATRRTGRCYCCCGCLMVMARGRGCLAAAALITLARRYGLHDKYWRVGRSQVE